MPTQECNDATCGELTLLFLVPQQQSRHLIDAQQTPRDFGRCNCLKRNELNFWLGGLDSNQDTQIQSLMSYRLDDLPAAGGNKTGPPSSPDPLV